MKPRRNKGDGFNNYAARKFNSIDKVELMSQESIYKLMEDEIKTMLEQLTASRSGDRYPTYIANGFANLSTAKWMFHYVEQSFSVDEDGPICNFTEDEAESIKTLLAEVYRKSVTNQYSAQAMEFRDRQRYISDAMVMLMPAEYHEFMKLFKNVKGDKKSKKDLKRSIKDLTVQSYGNPEMNFRHMYAAIDRSPVSNKKKLQILFNVYGERFPALVGAAMTVRNNKSDCLSGLYDFVTKLPKKKRKVIMEEYARAYKRNKEHNFRMESGGKFYARNRKIIKKLIEKDIGYKKAFKALKKPGVRGFEGLSKKATKRKMDIYRK